MKKIIEINNLDFHYSHEPSLFNNLTLEVNSGQIIGLTGKKGEGKSSVLKLISGLLFPLKGYIEVLGFEPRKRKLLMLQNIYFLPEEIRTAELSTESFENVYAPFYPHFSSSRFYKNINIFTLDSKCKNINELPLEEKKKMFIAFALATNAKLILLDEPTIDFDLTSKIQFKRILSETINKNCSIIVSMENCNELQDLIHTNIVLNNHEAQINQTQIPQ